MIFRCFVGQFLLVMEQQNRDTITDRQSELQVGAPPKLDCTFWESFLVDFVTHHTMSIFILTRKKMYRLHNGMTFSAISIL